MKLDEFVNVAKDCKNMNFRQVWEVYDRQFATLKAAIESLGDKFVVEEFKGSDGPVFTLNHGYEKGHTIVYVNDVIQWKDRDYTESSVNTVTLNNDLSSDDEVRIVIVLSCMLVNESDLIYSKVEDIVNKRIYEIVYNILKDEGIIGGSVDPSKFGFIVEDGVLNYNLTGNE